MSTTVNPALDAVQSFIKRAIWDRSVDLALSTFEAQAPYLAWGPIKWAVEGIVRYFSDKLFDLQKEEIDVTAITFLNADHQKVFDRELVKLKIVSHGHGPESPEYQEAEKNAFDAFEKFAHYNGA